MWRYRVRMRVPHTGAACTRARMKVPRMTADMQKIAQITRHAMSEKGMSLSREEKVREIKSSHGKQQKWNSVDPTEWTNKLQ